MGIKKAELAGSWYRGDREGLLAEVERCLDKADREYGRFSKDDSGMPVAIIVPHAGLAYSGPIAAAAFRLLRDRIDRVDAFVVFAACHRARLSAPAIWGAGAWETPLGDIPVDAGLASALAAAGAGILDERPHHGDNAIELQTPFIRHMFPEAAMVPVAMGFFPDSWRFGEIASGVAAGSGKRIAAVASTDLTHYGASFGITPAGTGGPALEWMDRNDRRFLDTLIAMDLENIVPVASRDGSACGAGAAAAAAGWAKALGCRKGRLLAHANSHEIAPRGEASHMVGYASLAYELHSPA